MKSGSLSLAYSIADQNFLQTKSLGILNLSMQLAEVLSSRREIHRLDLFSNSSLRTWHAQFPQDRVYCFDRACATRLGRMLWDQREVYDQASKHCVQWLLLPKGFASFCRKPRVKLAAYVHDVIGHWYRGRYPGTVARGEAWYFRRSLLATLRHSTVVFTNSDFTRRELIAFSQIYGVRVPEIIVAGIGFNRPRITARGDRRRIMVLASPWPHKRTDLAVQFMAAWQQATHSDARIDWVGRFPSGLDRPAAPNWEYHERVDDRAYQALLAESRAIVYFSEYEGFGMPPVEAVLSGACPVYSAIPATEEVMCGAGAPFDNAAFESFAAAMRKALQMTPSALASDAELLVSRHNWSAVADRVTGVLLSHTGQCETALGAEHGS